MPAATLSLRIAYSGGEIWGTWRTAGFSLPTRWGGPGWGRAPGLAFRVGLIGGKLAHRLRDLFRVGHEELFLWDVERHRGDIGCRDANHRPVEVLESVLGDDCRHLSPKPACAVVLVHDDRLARLADRVEDRLPVERRQSSQVHDLDADALRFELLRRLQAVVGHQTPGKAAQLRAGPPDH